MKYFITSVLICFLMLFTDAFAAKHAQREENETPHRRSKRVQAQPTAARSPAVSNANGESHRKKRKRAVLEKTGKKTVRWAELPPKRNGKKGRPLKKQKSNPEDTSAMDVVRTLVAEIESLQQEIALGHERAEPSIIRAAGRRFEELVYTDRKWRTYARRLGAYRWPSQESWKDVVGGHLFFPQETCDWENIACEAYRVTRIDNLWAYAVAAKLKHAVGKYYLVRMLDKLRGIYYEERPTFFDKLYREAFGDLKQCRDNSEACYIIGYNYHDGIPFLSSHYVEKDEIRERKDVAWHLKGGNLRNQYQILLLKRNHPHIYGSVTAEEFLALARAGYGPAYEEAYELVEPNEHKESILREAIATGFKPALLWLGYLSEDMDQLEKARELYNKAIENRVSQAFIDLGILIVGDVLYESREKRKDLTSLTQEEIAEGIEWFTRAGEAHNPGGWDYLAKLYAELRALELIEKGDFKREYAFCLRKGMQLGSKRAYLRSFNYFTEKTVDRLRDRYGERPHCELRLVMEQFLNNID